MEEKKPWWQDAESLAWVVMATLVLCLCSFVVTGTFLLIRWWV